MPKQCTKYQSNMAFFRHIWSLLTFAVFNFSHLEHVPTIISSFGYLYTLDPIIIITKLKIVEPFVNRKNQKSCFTYCWVVSKVRVASNLGVDMAHNLASLDPNVLWT